ncbi:MAG: EscU/YscU/HrcU family type III secretion system export apparatus switch protein, partial [Firmicutes bacterium]|nr:EscU/YscU/HrcU family type III secretion system export apparatus switch protein [Bacillota bacterium]
TLKGILKIVVLLYLIYRALIEVYEVGSKFLYTDIVRASAYIFEDVMALILQIAVAFGALAALDFFYQRWEYERQLRMTKQEVKEEYKQVEGNPQIKGKIREIQRRMAQMRMMQQVPKADVVIKNPTHFAVALRYKPEMDNAPVVLALGRDELALRIIKTAEENNVAVVANPPLARSLYEATDIGYEIPMELYGPVAEILVYIFRLDKNNNLVK